MFKHIILALTILIFVGCGIPTTANSIYSFVITKDVAVCNSIVIGKTTEKDVTQIIGKVISIKRTERGDEKVHKVGNLYAKVIYKDGVVADYSCGGEELKPRDNSFQIFSPFFNR